GIKTSDERILRVSPPGPGLAGGPWEAGTTSARSGRRAVTAFAAMKIADCLLKIGTAEIRPQGIDEDEFGISRLPEQEIADALLAAGPDEEVGIGSTGGEQRPRQPLLIDVLGFQAPGSDLFGELARCLHDVVAAAIGQRHDESQPDVGVCELL